MFQPHNSPMKMPTLLNESDRIGMEHPLFPDGADPWITFHDGYYYYTHTTRVNITVWKSRTIAGLPTGEMRVVWEAPATGLMSKEIWAPELHILDGKAYIYFAASDELNENHRSYVLEADDPMGPYREKGQITDPTNRWAIDGTVLEMENGERYFIWSGWEGFEDGQQNLYIARMKNPWTIDGERVLISSPTEPWEWEARQGPKVNEGPAILKKNGQIFIVYSADQSWTDNYKLAALRYLGSSPLDPQSWEKIPFPLLSTFRWGQKTYVAPGHCSFVQDPLTSTDWVLFHTAKQSGAGWDRKAHVFPFIWDESALPMFFPLEQTVEVTSPRLVPSANSQ